MVFILKNGVRNLHYVVFQFVQIDIFSSSDTENCVYIVLSVDSGYVCCVA